MYSGKASASLIPSDSSLWTSADALAPMSFMQLIGRMSYAWFLSSRNLDAIFACLGGHRVTRVMCSKNAAILAQSFGNLASTLSVNDSCLCFPGIPAIFCNISFARCPFVNASFSGSHRKGHARFSFGSGIWSSSSASLCMSTIFCSSSFVSLFSMPGE